MNFYITVISAIIAFSCVQGEPSLKDRKKAIFSECQSSTKLDPEVAKTFDGDKIPVTEQERCFLKCFYEKSGMVVNNAFSPPVAKAMALIAFTGDDLAKMNKMIDRCAPEIKADPAVKCDIGRAVRECFHHKGKEEGFFPKV